MKHSAGSSYRTQSVIMPFHQAALILLVGLLGICHHANTQTPCPVKVPGEDGFLCDSSSSQFYQKCQFGTTIQADDPFYRCPNGYSCSDKCKSACTAADMLPCECQAGKSFYCLSTTSYIPCIGTEEAAKATTCNDNRVCSNLCDAACQQSTACTTTTAATTPTTTQTTTQTTTPTTTQTTTPTTTQTTTPTTTQTTTPTTTTAAPFKCSSEGRFSDDNDCKKYYQCYAYTGGFDTVHTTCSSSPTVSYWDLTLKYCRSDSSVCGTRPK